MEDKSEEKGIINMYERQLKILEGEIIFLRERLKKKKEQAYMEEIRFHKQQSTTESLMHENAKHSSCSAKIYLL